MLTIHNVPYVLKHINDVYEDDVAELKARMVDVWELLKVRQKDEL